MKVKLLILIILYDFYSFYLAFCSLIRTFAGKMKENNDYGEF